MQKRSMGRVLLGSVLVTVAACNAGETGDVEGTEAALGEAAAEVVTKANAVVLVERNLVRLPAAQALAEDFAARSFGRAERPVVGSAQTVSDERDGQPSLYVFNFQGGGFVLVSADKRQLPIAGFSEEDDFDALGLTTGQAPDGVRGHVSHAKEYLHDIRTGGAAPVTNAKNFEQFRDHLSRAKPGDGNDNFTIPDPDTCLDSYAHTYELNFLAKWNQDCGWNDEAPTASGGPCGRAWAGCTAVATAQVMKYYAYPPSLNWAAMSNDVPQSATAFFLRDVGNRLGMDWGGGGSSASTEEIDNVLEGYGYSTTASYGDHSFDKVRNELKVGRPVIMRGTRDCDFLGFPTCGGHAWVVTGVKDNYDCGSQTYPRFYKMNWGWGGSYNGWYATGGLTPGGNNYNYHQSVVTGIKP